MRATIVYRLVGDLYVGCTCESRGFFVRTAAKLYTRPYRKRTIGFEVHMSGLIISAVHSLCYQSLRLNSRAAFGNIF